MSNKASITPPLVSIYFSEPEVNLIFAQLLASWGCKIKVLKSLTDLRGETKIVTEAQYFPLIKDSYRNKCLIVGNGENIPDDVGVVLTQPLTEAKVERAIQRFLEI